MNRFLATVATLIVCATPALAESDEARLGGDDPPEESWQEEAQRNAERRRRERAEGCPVD